MVKPTKPTVPTPALRSQPATFSANLEDTLLFFPTLATYMDDIADFVDVRADEALAAALGGALPSLSGHALEFLRVKSDGSAAEFKRAMSLTAGAVSGDVALTAVGKAIIEAADAAAQRTALGLGAAALLGTSTNTDFTVSTTLLSNRSTIKNFYDANSIGVGQTWQNVAGSRAQGTSYQNTTGKPIIVSIRPGNLASGSLQLSTDNSTFVTVVTSGTVELFQLTAVIPNGHYYKLTGVTIGTWVELR
jgi:hypothetical protein